MTLSLVTPSKAYQESYHAYIEELGDEERYPFPLDFDASDFTSMLNKIACFRQGISLPEGYVSSSTYWLVDGKDIVGVSNLRHSLNEQIRFAGGHIGLGIRPSFRRKGIGKILLSQTIECAHAMGIDDIHIHCYADNLASQALIVACGGRLDSTDTTSDGTGLHRYRVFGRPENA